MRSAFVAHDFRRTIEAFDNMQTLAQFESRQPLLIDGLTANSIAMLANRELRWELTEAGFSEPTCIALLEIAQRRSIYPDATLYVHGERVLILDTIQHVFTDDGNGDGWLIFTQVAPLATDSASRSTPRILNLLSPFFAGRRESVCKLNEVMLDQEALSHLAPVDRVRLGPPGGDIMKSTAFSGISLRHYIVLGLEMPNFMQALQGFDVCATESAATRLMLALHIYKLRHNAYPASLSDLVPDILPALILDPLNNLPFGYRLLENDPQNRPYLLYSLGLDGLDQQGAMPDLKKYKPEDPTLPDTRKAMTEIIPFDSVIDCVRPPR